MLLKAEKKRRRRWDAAVVGRGDYCRDYFLVDEDEDVPLLPVEPLLPALPVLPLSLPLIVLPLLPMPLESLPEDPLPRPVDPVL